MTSPAQSITSAPAPQAKQVYRIGHVWYAPGVTHAHYPGMMQALGTPPSHANDLYPFATKYAAEIALARVQKRLPSAGQTVKWTVSGRTLDGRRVPSFRFGTVQSTRGNYAVVATSTDRTERIRLDKLIIVEPEEVQA